MIADGIPEIAQARRLDNRIIETYSHVAPEVEKRERRWHKARAAVEHTNPPLTPVQDQHRHPRPA